MLEFLLPPCYITITVETPPILISITTSMPTQTKPTYFIRTFGCQMNKSDSERIAAVMNAKKYRPADEKLADILIVNTCSVRQSAEDRAVGQIRSAEQRRQKIVITGCLAQQKSFRKKYGPEAIFCDISKISGLPKLLQTKNQTSKIVDYLSVSPAHTSPVEAYVPIMTGCNNFCSYCIVPYVRGPERSRPVKDILTEINSLAGKGHRQITLLGQNVNSYRCGATDFSKLLARVAQCPGNFRVFFLTSHPKDFSRKIINLIKKYPKLCPYFHLPIQAGSNRILKKMNRHYTVAQYLKIITDIRRLLPTASITTDLIVGFPGETKADFRKSVALFKKAQFDLAYIARYSPRPGTASAKVADDVSSKEKARRAKILDAIIKQSAMARNEKLIGQIMTVLVEKVQRQGKIYLNFGKNELLKTVKFTTAQNCLNQLVPVRLTAATSWGLYGHAVV